MATEDLCYDTDSAPLAGTCPAPVPLGGIEMASLMSNIPQKVMATKQSNLMLGERPITVDIDLGAEAKATLNAMAAGDKPLNLTIEGPTFSRQPGVRWEICLNLPVSQASEPDIENGHFVGNLAFFGRMPHGGYAAPAGADKQPHNITEVVWNPCAKNLWNGDRLSVTFVARGLDIPEGKRENPRVLDSPRFTRIPLVVE